MIEICGKTFSCTWVRYKKNQVGNFKREKLKYLLSIPLTCIGVGIFCGEGEPTKEQAKKLAKQFLR